MDKTKLYCSFCGKSQDEIEKLVVGPGQFICNECVDLCHDICHQGSPPAPEPPRHAQLDPLLGVIRSNLLTLASQVADIQLRLLEERPPRLTPGGEIVSFAVGERRWPDDVEDAFAGDEDGLFEWTPLSARETGLSFEIWVCDIRPIVAVTEERHLARDELNRLYRWFKFNAETLANSQSGAIDTAEFCRRLQRLP